MRAIQITELTGPERALQLVDIPEPEASHPFSPGSGVIVDVHAAGVSFPELLQTRGQYQIKPPLPFVPGSEVAGVVRQAPPGSRVQPGDRVAAFCMLGGWASVAVAPEVLTFALSDQLDFAQGAGLILNYHTAYFALETRARLRPGETVLVHGAAGGVGTAALQVAHGLGARTIAVVSSDAKEAVARQAGADEVVRSDGPWKDQAIALTGDRRGVDIVIDPVGGDRFTDSLRALREGGRLVVVGFTAGAIPEVRVNRLLLNNTSVVGAGWGAYVIRHPEASREIGDAVAHLIDQGFVDPVVGARFPPEQASEALLALERRQATGKIVIEFAPLLTMDFAPSPTATKLRHELLGFMDEHVYPAEAVGREQLAALGDPHGHPPVLEELKSEARRRGLWNLFFPGQLSNVDYAPLAEIMGRSLLGAEACNCSAPDTGNMELLSLFGSDEQKQRWLDPLLEGTIRSAFAMTEPAVASSDATNIACRIERAGGDYVINGRKWWISGAASKRCAVFIVMGKTEPEASPYRQQSMVLVPADTPGVTVVRNLPVFGYADREGHCEVVFDDVRVPVGDILGEEGGGFAMAQARLGPGRIHHCMRTIGAAERALELLCRRVLQRHAFGKALAEQGVIQEWIADARIEIDQARLYTLHAAWLMDTQGNKSARTAVSGIKVAVPLMALRVIDHAIQAHGAAGIGDDFPLAWMYAHIRTLRLADGPDEVHRGVVARHELRRWA